MIPILLDHKYLLKQGKGFAHNVINYTDFKNLNTEAFLSDLRDSPWVSAFVFDDLDDVLDTFELLLGETDKRHIPNKQKRVKKQKEPEWMNERIVDAIKKHNQELKKARKSNDANDWTKFKCIKCFVTNLIRKSKRVFFQESIENSSLKREFKRNMETLKSLAKSKKQNNIKELVREHGSIEMNVEVMANMFNEFFVTIAGALRANLLSVDLDTSKLEYMYFVSSRLYNYITQFNIPAITVQQT